MHLPRMFVCRPRIVTPTHLPLWRPLHTPLASRWAVRQRPLTTSTQTSIPPDHPPQSKFKTFMKKYGPVSLAVYLGFSVIDLSLTMTAIHLCGSEKVLRLEHYVKTEAAKLFGRSPPPPLSDSQLHQEPSWTSIFVLAYGIHKTILLPVRLSLTMATTPAIARRLVRYGWIKPIPKSKPPTSSL